MAFKAQNIGGEVKVIGATYVTQGAAGATTGSYVNCKTDTDGGSFDSMILAYNVANVTGSPDSFTATFTVNDATDTSGTGAAAYKPDGATAISVVVTAAGKGKISVNLKNARATVAPKVTLAFVNGTTPKADVQMFLVAGGPTNTPIPD